MTTVPVLGPIRAALVGLAAAFAFGFAFPSLLLAQDQTLARVEELTSEGRFASAREELAAWFGSAWDRSSRDDRQRGLWLRGRLTVDGGMAERDYRRLVVEYPGGPFSDEALLRLAQIAWARGDNDAALRHLRMLARDYPESEHRAEALELSARLSAEPGAAGTVVLPAAPGVMQGGVIPASASPPGAPATSSVPTMRGPGDVGPATGQRGSRAVPEAFDGMPFTIELGAFSTEPPAQAIASAAIAAGVEVRMVGLPGSGLIHVRTGAFFSQMEAQARALALRLQGLPAAVAPDRAEEEPR